jgi:hypothetical protein
MVLKLANFESLAPNDIGRLEVQGIVDTDGFLLQASSRELRRQLSARSGLDETLVARLARAADLARILGLIEPHVLLLEALGVGNVRTLRAQDPALLVKALRRKNVELTLVRSVPPESIIARWVSDASALPLILED